MKEKETSKTNIIKKSEKSCLPLLEGPWMRYVYQEGDKQLILRTMKKNNFVGHRKQVEGLLRKRTISDVLVTT
ncbi:hypothetical protein Taro_013008 [Colocasia esculenta]|uniref:Uncharacterized protein n=1 Tax=Colocasia esculenta TaxID=4460 RepID=A0A843UF47_COLES|nr:hypothetical protein [Colocasia esculenta]